MKPTSSEILSRLSPLLLAGLVCLSGSHLFAQELAGQVVTFANFSYVNYIASSLTHTYFATTSGITRFSKIDNRWEEPLTGTIGIDHRNISRIWVDRFDEKLYVSTNRGYFELDHLFDRWFPIDALPDREYEGSHVRPPQIMYPPSGYVYAPESGLSDLFGRDFVFSDVLDDETGRLWIGTWGLGAFSASSSATVLEPLNFGLLQNRVDFILNDGGLLWLSGAVTEPGRTGITVIDIDSYTFDYFESGLTIDFSASDISCLEGNGDELYIGTNRGLLVMDPQNSQITRTISARHGLTDDRIISMEKTGDSLYVGTDDGLNLIRDDLSEVLQLWTNQFANRAIYDLLLVDSSLWIASSDGVYRISLPLGRLQRFQDPSLFLFGDVYDIELYDQQLWFISKDGLLQLDLETARTESFRSFAALPWRRTAAINDRLAVVAADRGITLIYYQEDPIRFREITTDDGLPSEYVYSLSIDGDYVWIGSDKGLSRFWWNNPNRLD